MVRRASILLAAVAAVTVAGCSDTTASTGAEALVGVYILQTVDGQPLPAIVDQSGADMLEVVSGSVSLHTGLTFDDTTVLRFTISGEVSTETDAATGNFTLSGRTVQFTPSDNSGVYTMTWDGQDELTQDFNGLILVYKR
ncbi:MAG TPA: hypothetical protein VFU23_07405 [Gemmatimonadales bacterium]|nr:hypothetical protein [Gemmatimonadales bacterium]